MKIFMFFLLFFASTQGIIQPRMTMNFYLPATGTGHKAATIISYNK